MFTERDNCAGELIVGGFLMSFSYLVALLSGGLGFAESCFGVCAGSVDSTEDITRERDIERLLRWWQRRSRKTTFGRVSALSTKR
jgi:hypothetical protein